MVTVRQHAGVLPGSEDPRVRRTRGALQGALASLVLEGSPVTMSAVAQRAGLSRQALHARYESIGQLASEVLARRMLEGTGNEAPSDPASLTPALVEAVSREGLTPFLTFIGTDRDAFQALRHLAHAQSAAVLAQVFEGLLADLSTTTGDGPAALFAAGGMTALVDAWLGDDDAPTPAEQAAVLERYARAVFGAGS